MPRRLITSLQQQFVSLRRGTTRILAAAGRQYG
jgi:hypothetical protein